MTRASETSIAVSDGQRVSALLLEPEEPRCLLVFAHGAGAGMRHETMETFVRGVAGLGIATLRFRFPYRETGRRPPNPRPVLQRTVRAAVAQARTVRPELPLLAGGRSMGGRMASGADAADALDVAGFVFHAFPLHPPGKPGTSRADHLSQVEKPMLFLNGTRDRLADPELLTGVCDRLGSRATLHFVEGGDHSLHVLKRSGRRQEDVDREVADAVSVWCREALGL
ncbi:MAG: alpha/beta hydrolase [Acidobacteria bacterium]|nr:alpha/beta hydrolase [Acidobacteriota bacterium]